ncbi:hypothetical protein AMK25_05405 [Micromonospora sp. TSRI0369]|uniref:hypothetical protein n=1 Tax=Micromonospora sp. TSRI0369 TaxID=1703936 RepID=UPI00093B338C|nr:hypothetical protein [Micromonospora sp. TSRI0369]OKJ46003.1 hypothetical protein AMK25_05405 [Micromonospora sp. TSRI0369]
MQLWPILLSMSTVSTLLSGVVDVLPQIVTGGCTLGAAWLTYRFGERQRARDKVASTNKKIEELGQELFEAVGALHLALKVYVPAHNSWQPKLMTLGSAFLEYMAAKTTSGHALGAAQLGRVATEANQRELAAAMGLQAPLQRVLAVAGRAAMLDDGEVREAALKLGQVAAESGQAYGQDNLWRPKKAKAARDQADTELYEAMDVLLTAVKAHLSPAVKTPRRSWRPRLRRPAVVAPAAAAIQATVPQPRAGEHDERATSSLPTRHADPR